MKPENVLVIGKALFENGEFFKGGLVQSRLTECGRHTVQIVRGLRGQRGKFFGDLSGPLLVLPCAEHGAIGRKRLDIVRIDGKQFLACALSALFIAQHQRAHGRKAGCRRMIRALYGDLRKLFARFVKFPSP